ncbi:hypothetical protein GEMRC1_006078 [Eukaryota sp. GEM-RC1]
MKETKRDTDRKRSKKGAWTAEEDRLLREAVAVHKPGNWKLIAQHVPGRTDQQCLRHWEKVLNPSIRKGRWMAEEDMALVRAVSLIGEGRWSEVSRYVTNRTDKQIHLRWGTLKRTETLSSARDDSFDDSQLQFLSQAVAAEVGGFQSDL